jgi:cation diffusion facilitator CzcD-associated flavoprotein CzcO/acetyl esterase/lipase
MSPKETGSPLAFVVVGAGFGGIGMGIALLRAGVRDFVVVEKGGDVGGVWRDNTYPGAACDVPSHLYSFSFEPNPGWSRVYSPQAEILDYLKRCVQKYGLAPHLRLNTAVTEARYDEQRALWQVELADGSVLHTQVFVSATGQLSRPAAPHLEGSASFEGRAFHSARWDATAPLAGSRVAVVGTGASAAQFVPALAGEAAHLTVFQRSPAYLLPRGDRAYSGGERALLRRVPALTRLYRLGHYLRYEARAPGFGALQALMEPIVGRPFRRMLKQQVPDAALRAALTPSYPIGCKRILLSDDYLAAFARPNVTLVTEAIRRITPHGIETADGARHPADTIVYGTGFAAHEFLVPMRIVGRDGRGLNDAWRHGAQAYLGIAVPGFPNFFMLYGPNTNLGHNSIVYMLESQIAHVMRVWQAMRACAATSAEVGAVDDRRFNARIQRRLARSVWAGCRNWYVDAGGLNSSNWPGFTLTYRWLTRRAATRAYHLASVLPGLARGALVAEPPGRAEAWMAACMRGVLRVAFRLPIGPPLRRSVVALVAPLMPGSHGAARRRETVAGVPVEVVTPKRHETEGVLLYLHGGAFCLGGPRTHRSITTRLARHSGLPVWVPDYRLAPEHPYPAALDDALACYDALRASGHAPGRIVIAGDSAGAALALALALRLRERGDTLPAALLLLSPLTDPSLGGPTMATERRADPMTRRAWLEQGLRGYACPPDAMEHRPLETDLRGLPPMLVQAGAQEVLLSDAMRLADHAAQCGVACRLEVYARRWHVFQLQSFYLRSGRQALETLAAFARERVRPVDDAAA